jgi:hypothetical protein
MWWFSNGSLQNSGRITSWLGILSVVVLAVYWQSTTIRSSSGRTEVDLCEERISVHSIVRDVFPFVNVSDNDNDDRLLQLYNISTCDVFSEHYDVARERFRRLVQQIDNAHLTTIPVVTVQDDNNSDNPYEYTMDVALIPGNNERGLVVHVAGTHGVEGYAGSAIQLAFLKTWKNIILPSSSSSSSSQNNNNNNNNNHKNATDSWPTIVLVHAFNPYGMAHDRRTNENNVDLNRNGVVSNNDSDDPYFQKPNNPWWNEENYELFRSLFHPNEEEDGSTTSIMSICSTTPTSEDSSWKLLLEGIQFWIHAIRAVIHNGVLALKAAMVSGQYHDPRGLFYGGSSLQPSIALLEQYFHQHLMPKIMVPSSSDTIPIITWIDVHTGLGEMGYDSLLHRHGQVSTVPSEDFWNRELERWFPQTLTDPEHTQVVSSGYEKSQGFVIDYFYQYFTKQYESIMMDATNDSVEEQKETTEHPPWLFFAQEFGTFPVFTVGRALITENSIRQNCPNLSKAQQLQWARATTRKVFYPDSTQWREQVVQRGLRVLFQAILRSNSSASHNIMNDNHTSVPPVVVDTM